MEHITTFEGSGPDLSIEGAVAQVCKSRIKMRIYRGDTMLPAELRKVRMVGFTPENLSVSKVGSNFLVVLEGFSFNNGFMPKLSKVRQEFPLKIRLSVLLKNVAERPEKFSVEVLR